ncbi:MAG: M20/M25/M40 family metallo-hydrolase [Desulfobacteraceae bacterium]|nr:M20/M25/M40 family metallo-hydrolase [Desulfobacteraceae bacterium]
MTNYKINEERLTKFFMDLVQIDSISKEEADVADYLLQELAGIGGRVFVDGAGKKAGANTGNIIFYFKGNADTEPILLSAHMDTVEPGRGIKPVLRNGNFTSSGDTILGADDKSAIAVIIEALHCIKEHNLPCGPLEVVFTICEEIGLIGAKHFDFEKISARKGYVLDTKNYEAIITRAPAANRLTFKVYGKAAHAGSAPETGINAISLASKAIANLELGRIDENTTCNIGVIEGGLATNIVPEHVVVKGEVRSHSKDKLNTLTDTIVASFKDTLRMHEGLKSGDLPKVKIEVELDFDTLQICDNHPVVKLARKAASNLNRSLLTAATGGGSDANIFNVHGIATAVLGTGMEDVHTVNESIRLKDMSRSTELLLEILHLHTKDLAKKC